MPGNRLRVTDGAAAGTSIDVGDELIVGRNEEGPGQLAGDAEISRRHARLYTTPEGGLAVQDLGSTNGTFVDGKGVTGSVALTDGATLRMGHTTLVVELAEVAEEEPAPPPVPPQPPLADATQIDRPVPPAEPPAGATQIDQPIPPPPPPLPPPPPAPVAGVPAAAPPPAGPVPPPPAVAPPPPGAAPPSAAPAPGGAPRVLVAVLVGVLALAGIGIAAVLVFGGGDDDEDSQDQARSGLVVTGPPALVSAARAAGCTATTEPSEGREHVETTPRYRSNPPHSGPHDPTPAGDGQYREAPPITQLVHALEHGRIIMWFKPGDGDTRQRLLAVGNEDARQMILTPNSTRMPYQAAASAWRHVLGCPEMNDKVPDAVRAFRDAYRGKGPELRP